MRSITNRKKIRGWKRRLKALDKWAKANAVPSTNALDSRGHDYVKLWIDPWYRLVKRNPPLWFFNHLLDKIDLIYRQWDAYMQNTGRHYDLQMWVAHPWYIRSEVVVDVVKAPGEQRNNYFEMPNEQTPFPEKLYTGGGGFHPKNYTWQMGLEHDLYHKNLDALPKVEVEQLLKKGYTAKTIILNGVTDVEYSKVINKVWIGRLKR